MVDEIRTLVFELSTSKVKSIVLGDWSEDSVENRAMAISAIKRLVSGKSFMPEKEEGPFLLRRFGYDSKKNRLFRNLEEVGVKITRVGDEVSVEIEDGWVQSSLKN